MPAGDASSAGGSSSTKWALVPDTPKLFTAPILRPLGPAGHGRRLVTTSSDAPASSMLGLSVSKCRLGGSSACLSASATLSRPAIPEASVVCPTFDLIEPTPHGGMDGERACIRAASAFSSIGSPSWVPAPWVSM